MKNLFESWRGYINKVNEAIYPSKKQAILYHGTQQRENIEKILKTGFDPGGGDMYGPGLYTVYDLEYEAQTSHGGYGRYIIKFAAPITDKTVIFDRDIGKEVFGEDYFWYDHLKQLVPDDILAKVSLTDDYEYSSKEAQDVVSAVGKSNMPEFFDAFVFTGQNDGRVMVLYKPNTARILSWKRLTDNVDHFEIGEIIKYKDQKIEAEINYTRSLFFRDNRIHPDFYQLMADKFWSSIPLSQDEIRKIIQNNSPDEILEIYGSYLAKQTFKIKGFVRPDEDEFDGVEGYIIENTALPDSYEFKISLSGVVPANAATVWQKTIGDTKLPQVGPAR